MSAVDVLFVNHEGLCGGAEESLLALITHLDRTRFTPHLAAPAGGPLAARASEADVHIHHLDVPRLRRRHPLHLKILGVAQLSETRAECARLIRMIQPALVHANSNLAQLVVARAVRRRRVPVIWHSRDVVPLGLTGRWMARRADRIIAVSDAVAANLRESCGAGSPVQRIYNGIDPERVRARRPAAELRGTLGVPDGAHLLLSVGQLVPWKRHDRAVRCLAGIDDAVLAICGSDQFGDHPEAANELRVLAESQGVADRVRVLGQRDDVPDLLNAADIVVHPAEREPFGRVVVEAMFAGRPVVAFDAGGPAEILRDGETGSLVPAGDEAAFAEAIRLLASDALRRARLGEAARRDARERFTAAIHAAQVQDLYTELLAAE